REIVGPESPDDLNRLLGPGNAIGDSTPGSVLDLPFPGGFTWRLQFHGGPGVCHFLCHPDFADPVCLGWDDPHPRLPVLPWREARRIVVDLADWWRSGPAPVPECFILPLFMPMITWRSGDQGEERA